MSVLADPQSRAYARTTGILYLSIAVFGAFAIGYVPSVIVVSGDPMATLANITDRAGLYLAGIGADAMVMLIEIVTLTMLYLMFRPVSATLSFAAAMARLSMVGVMAAMLFFHAGLGVLAEPGALPGFTADQRAGIAGLLLDMHHAGVWIWQLFFSLHLVLLGWLVRASGLYPRLLGLAMMIGATGYAADTLYAFAFPEFAALGTLRIGLLVLVTLAEVGFALWLVIRGPRPAV